MRYWTLLPREASLAWIEGVNPIGEKTARAPDESWIIVVRIPSLRMPKRRKGAVRVVTFGVRSRMMTLLDVDLEAAIIGPGAQLKRRY